MANIQVTVTGVGANRTVAAVDNSAAADQGDSVAWNFNSNTEMFRVVFKKVELLNGESLLINEQGPFSMPLSVQVGQVSGEVASNAPDGLYFYDIHDSN